MMKIFIHILGTFPHPSFTACDLGLKDEVKSSQIEFGI